MWMDLCKTTKCHTHTFSINAGLLGNKSCSLCLLLCMWINRKQENFKAKQYSAYNIKT